MRKTKTEPEFKKASRHKTVKVERLEESTSASRAEESKTTERNKTMDKAILIIILVGVLAGALYFSGARTGYEIGAYDTWSPRAYVPANGDCFVPPQGDPLYDREYSKINQNNCTAFKTQSEAWNIDAETNEINWEVSQSRIGTSAMLLFAVAIIGFFVWVILK